MADIGKAYIQIIPSAEGIKGSLTEMFEGEAKDAGQKTGSKLGTGIKKAAGAAAKVAAGAMAATTTAVSALAKESVSAYADFEQLSGGIETLFGSAAPTVMKNAEKAFSTAGQSINDYMETSIQSAASLINSVGGDTAKAADLMDMSIVDMADNVNKMGTTMEGVQNAYRGFSRGNFMMLDNLALGFAGTKEGMQELLDKAKELSGIEYDINSYADIVQAIHVVQTEIGITGTTAKEGAETISGSLAQVKSAWTNLVAGLANPTADLDKLIENTVSSAETAANNLMPAIEKGLVGISEFIGKIAPVLADKLPGIIEKIAPSLINAAVILLDALIDALPVIIPPVMDAIVDAVKSNPKSLLILGPLIVGKLAKGISGALNLLDPVGKLISKKLGGSITSSLTSELSGMAPTISGAVSSIGKFMTADIGSTVAAGGATAGATIGTALVGGIVAAIGGAEIGKKLGAVIFPDDAEIYEEYSGIKGTFNMLGEFFVTLYERTGEHLQELGSVISEFFSNVKTDVSNWWGDVSATFTQFGNTVSAYWNEFWGTLYEFYKPVIEAIQYTTGIIFDAIKQKFASDIEAIKSIFSEAYSFIESNVFPLLYAGQVKVEEMIDGIKKKFSDDIEAIKNIANEVLSFIESNIFPKIYAGQEKLEGIIGKIKEKFFEEINALKQKFSDDVEAIKEIFNSLGGFFVDLAQSAKTWGSDLMTSFAEGFESGKDTVAAGIRSIGDKIKANMGHSHPTEGPLADDYKWMPDMVDLFAKGISDNAGKLGNAVGNLAGDVRGSMPVVSKALQNGGYQGEVSPAGYGDLTIPVYIGNQKFGQAVVNANQINNYRNGGR